jgi:hypothetical protein
LLKYKDYFLCLAPHFRGDSCDEPGALAARSVPPTTANGSTKLDKNGMAKRNVNIVPKAVQT